MQIKHTTALITGANRGIGRALVHALLDRGARKIYATGRNLQSLQQVRDLDPKRIEVIELDVTNSDQVRAAAQKAPDVSLLFNNAGVLDLGSLLEVSGDAVHRNMDVNFYGLLNVAHAFAPALGVAKGSMVNLLTMVALASMPGIGAYNASKAAAWSLTQSLRADFGKKGVKVVGVFPGAIDTDMIKGFEMPKTAPAEAAEAILTGIEQDQEDIFPDPMSRELYATWKADHKAVERLFAAMEA